MKKKHLLEKRKNLIGKIRFSLNTKFIYRNDVSNLLGCQWAHLWKFLDQPLNGPSDINVKIRSKIFLMAMQLHAMSYTNIIMFNIYWLVTVFYKFLRHHVMKSLNLIKIFSIRKRYLLAYLLLYIVVNMRLNMYICG